MSASVESFAAGMEAAAKQSPEAFTAYMKDFWADHLIGEHEPPAPKLDGAKTPKIQYEAHAAQDRAFRAVMPDYRLDGPKITIAGAKVELSAIIAGAPRTGGRVALPVTWVFTLNEGRVDHVLTIVDMEVARPNLEILRAAGIMAT